MWIVCCLWFLLVVVVDVAAVVDVVDVAADTEAGNGADADDESGGECLVEWADDAGWHYCYHYC